MQKVNRSRRTSLWKGSGACLSCCCEHLPDAPNLGAERCFKPSTLHWSLPFGNSRWHGSTMGRRSGGLVGSAHGRGSTASSRPSCVIRDAVNYKLDRLPLPVNDLVVLGHQRRRWRMCTVLLEAHATRVEHFDEERRQRFVLISVPHLRGPESYSSFHQS